MCTEIVRRIDRGTVCYFRAAATGSVLAVASIYSWLQYAVRQVLLRAARPPPTPSYKVLRSGCIRPCALLMMWRFARRPFAQEGDWHPPRKLRTSARSQLPRHSGNYMYYSIVLCLVVVRVTHGRTIRRPPYSREMRGN